MKIVGGPMDGQERDWDASLVEVVGATEASRGRYVRWWDMPDDYDPDWFIRGLPEPEKPERYYLWQPRGQYRDHPAVAGIREAVREASGRFKAPG